MKSWLPLLDLVLTLLFLIDMPRAYRLHFFVWSEEQGHWNFTGEQSYVKDFQVPELVPLKIKGLQRKNIHAFEIAM